MSPRPTKTYAKAGVDIDAGDALVDYLKQFNKSIGGFSGLFPLPRGMRNPRLVASTDGVGTKLLVAQLAGHHESIGIDLVAMVVNDLVVCGARPLFFLDYFATGKLQQGEARGILKGIMEGCRQAGCPLIGGETAEMPGMYAPGHYDLAGFGVGVVEADEVIDGSTVRPGDLLIGLGSSGAHSNGFSLLRDALLPKEPAAARRALRAKAWRGGPTLAELLLTPTIIYVKPLLALLKKAKGAIGALAHITGGGLAGNLVRVLPRGVTAYIDTASWIRPRLFDLVAERGPVEEDELFRVFNMGIGMVLAVRPAAAKRLLAAAQAQGLRAGVIGWVDAAPTPRDAPQVLLVRAENPREPQLDLSLPAPLA